MLVDSEVNLNNSGVIIPDGMLAKVAGQNRFKVGNGVSTWSKLEYISSIALGNGLAFDENGQIVVDFSVMPTEKFEALVKSIRVPIWLNANKNFYVATTGSDVLSEGRGESTSLPFKTIQACINYIGNTYHLSTYNVYIYLASGDYSGGNKANRFLNLVNYQSTSGFITIIGHPTYTDGNYNEIKKYIVPSIRSFQSRQPYNFYGITIVNTNHVTLIDSCIRNESGITLSFSACILSINYKTTNIGVRFVLNSSGQVNFIWLNENAPIYIECTAENVKPIAFAYISGSTVQLTSDLTLKSSLNINNAFVYVYNSGTFIAATGAGQPRNPKINTNGFTVTGARYYASLNSIINTNKQGAEFFPGSKAGTLETGAQYN